MKRFLIAITTLSLVFGTCSGLLAADVAKIGVINFEKVLKDSSAGKLTQQNLKQKWEELQKKLNDKKVELDKLSKAFEREALVLSPEKKGERERDLRIRFNDLKKMQKDFTQEFKQIEAGHITQIQKDVFEIADAMGKDEGFLLIVERKTAGVIYAPAQVDITDKVIKAYNARVAKKN